MATIVSRDQARRERLKEGGVDDEAATAIGDVFTSFSDELRDELASLREDVSGQLSRHRDEFARALNIHTALIGLGLAAIGLLIGVVAVFG